MPSISYNQPNSITSSQLEPKLRDLRKTIVSYSSSQTAPQKQKEVPLCRVVITSNVSLTAFPQVQDGVSLQVYDLVLLVGQTDAKENGVYINSNPLGTLLRLDLLYYDYMIFCVGEGTKYKNTIWQLDSGNIVGTDNLNITRVTDYKQFKTYLTSAFNFYSGVYYPLTSFTHAIGSNEVWEYEYNLIFFNADTISSQDLYYKFSVPSGATIRGSAYYNMQRGIYPMTDMSVSSPDNADLTLARKFNTVNNYTIAPIDYIMTIKAIVINGSTSGNVIPTFLAGGALGFQVQPYSWVKANRIS